jgi:hypothetical protein
MNGFIRKAALGVCLGASLSALSGCVSAYRQCVDPCWPERYNYMARQSVRETFNAQAANGHTLDQTIWNQHFEPGTNKLTRQGEEHLKYIARRMPAPDPRVFVQVAYDGKGDPKSLNDQRAQAVQDYLGKIAAFRNMPVGFDVTVVDLPEPGLRARAAPSTYVTPVSATAPQALTPNPGSVPATSPTYQQQQQQLQQQGSTQTPVTEVR